MAIHHLARIFIGLVLFGALATPCSATVVSAAPAEFTVKQTLALRTKPADVYREFTEAIGSWWDPEHTYSGRSANLTIDARATGCFCERLGTKGSVAHMTVIYADPGKLLRMTGGLGPLQNMPLNAVMTISFAAVGVGTRVEITYSVGGQASQNLDKLAPVVDQVLTGQWARFAKFAEK